MIVRDIYRAARDLAQRAHLKPQRKGMDLP